MVVIHQYSDDFKDVGSLEYLALTMDWAHINIHTYIYICIYLYIHIYI
jgi:hypothetical protein